MVKLKWCRMFHNEGKFQEKSQSADEFSQSHMMGCQSFHYQSLCGSELRMPEAVKNLLSSHITTWTRNCPLSNRVLMSSPKDLQLSFESTCERDVGAINIGIFHIQQEPPWPVGLTQHWQLATATASAAACDFWCTGDKSFPQMSTSLWHLAPCHLFHTISLNGHTTLAHHDNWG